MVTIVKLAQFAVEMAAPMENNRSTAAELGKGVLYFINTVNQICRFLNRKNILFCKLQRSDPSDVVAL